MKLLLPRSIVDIQVVDNQTTYALSTSKLYKPNDMRIVDIQVVDNQTTWALLTL
jgi:hypothetical protein